MSLSVAWSLLSLLTWFSSKYQQLTGDRRFWSLLYKEGKCISFQFYCKVQLCVREESEYINIPVLDMKREIGIYMCTHVSYICMDLFQYSPISLQQIIYKKVNPLSLQKALEDIALLRAPALLTAGIFLLTSLLTSCLYSFSLALHSSAVVGSGTCTW